MEETKIKVEVWRGGKIGDVEQFSENGKKSGRLVAEYVWIIKSVSKATDQRGRKRYRLKSERRMEEKKHHSFCGVGSIASWGKWESRSIVSGLIDE
ncbi:hypothetical protein CEXT_537181 [Caerostris extrusa]|uniref:Uncharacterized protein n=1 Tax=Caerostris extrusa TaxID=172846 RepID=A0AAV4Y2G6_CAEEX|nr:hypothetical protein CEXT_537181 [Caerostris extrusa]